MKKTHFRAVLFALFTCSAAVNQASGTILWVDGVDQNSGWYDANKINPDSKDGDNYLCWAASASNLIAWWQDKYEIKSSIPNDIDSIWSTYKSNVTEDEGGDVHGAFLWWVTGIYQPTTEEEQNRSFFNINDTSTLPAWDGYYFADYGDRMNISPDDEQMTGGNSLWNFLCADYRNEATADNIISLLTQGCGMAISLRNDSSDQFAHAITLWGIEYDSDTNTISRMWLTDSDDAQYSWLGQDGLYEANVDSRDGKLYISTPNSDIYKAEDNVYISHLFAVNPSVSTGWGIPTAVIPEPTSAALSLVLPAGLTSRRRRK